MTTRKYLENAFKFDFMGTVIDLQNNSLGTKIKLDETYFYPEGGGQPFDQGYIGDFEIIDVQSEGDSIWHFTSSNIDPSYIGQKLTCNINSTRRIALMQQHTGQHLLSALAKKMFDASTVGFHIGEDYVTVDLDKKLTEEDVQKLEEHVQIAIFSNALIKDHYPESDELDKIPLRKQPKVTENIRVIEIENIDFSPCGGTHVKSTQEIIMLKIIHFENYKSGVRLTFVCGQWAYQKLKDLNSMVKNLMRILSSKETDIENAVIQLVNQTKSLKRDLQIEKAKSISLEVEKILSEIQEVEGLKVIKCFEENIELEDLRLKANKLCLERDIIFFGVLKTSDKQHIVLSKSESVMPAIKMNDIFKLYFIPLGAKGGGNDKSAQGGVDLSIELDTVFDAIENDLLKDI